MLGFCNFSGFMVACVKCGASFFEQSFMGSLLVFPPVCGSGEGAKHGLPARDSGDTRRQVSPTYFTSGLF